MTPRDPAPYCPECAFGPDLGLARRDFIRVVGASAAAVAAVGTTIPAARAAAKPVKAAKPAESLIHELFDTLKALRQSLLSPPADSAATRAHSLIEPGRSRGQGDAPMPDESPGGPIAAAALADTFSHQIHKKLTCITCHSTTSKKSTGIRWPPLR